jgi:hypothetical protein
VRAKIEITAEMVAAGASVIEDALLDCSTLEGLSGLAESIAPEVFLQTASCGLRDSNEPSLG